MYKLSDRFSEFAKKAYEMSKEKGWWEEGDARSKGEMVALMVTELSECIEGHRINKWAGRTVNTFLATVGAEPNNISLFKSAFEDLIKDTIEDELADTIIRIGDYVEGWNIIFFKRECRKESTGNFAHDILKLQKWTIDAFDGEHPAHDWGYVIAAIEKFCEWYNIEIISHIEWKMKYNSTRPHKHGNKAY